MYEISSVLRRISSHFPICDTSDIRCAANENVQIIAVFRPFFTATRRVIVASKIGDLEVNLSIKLHIIYIDQLVVPAIFNYSIGAKDVDRIQMTRFGGGYWSRGRTGTLLDPGSIRALR